MAEGGVRFGRAVDELPEQLEFGSWGVLDIEAALDAFADALAWFDQDNVIKSEADRVAMIRAARRYYDGYHTKPLKVPLGEPDDNVLINLCRALIDDAVSWLFGNPETGVLTMDIKQEAPAAGLEFGSDDLLEDPENPDDLLEEMPAMPDPGGMSEIGRLLEETYERSGGFHFFKRLGMRGSISGHAFVKLVEEEAGASASGC